MKEPDLRLAHSREEGENVIWEFLLQGYLKTIVSCFLRTEPLLKCQTTGLTWDKEHCLLQVFSREWKCRSGLADAAESLKPFCFGGQVRPTIFMNDSPGEGRRKKSISDTCRSFTVYVCTCWRDVRFERMGIGPFGATHERGHVLRQKYGTPGYW